MAYSSGCDNVAIGYRALRHVIIGPNAGKGPMGELGWPPVDDAPTGFWHCAYCGQSNAAEREGCRGCRAPRAEVRADDRRYPAHHYPVTINLEEVP